MAKKSEIELPTELIIWVNAPTAAAMLNYSLTGFNENVRYSERFKQMKVEQQHNRFSVDLLKKFGRGEYQ
jgi:hypothetical protein